MPWANRPFRLFSGQEQAANFARFATVFPVRVVRRSSSPSPMPHAPSRDLPASYVFGGASRSVEQFLADTETVGLIVATPQGTVHERHAPGFGSATLWPLWSITKSILSALAGTVPLDLDHPVTDHVLDLRGSGYDGVSIRHVMSMCSGVRWSENYADETSDIRRAQRARLAGGSQDAFAASLPRQHAPGSTHRYNTTDTEVLGRVLRALTGESLAALLEERIWAPLGMEDDVFWVVDGEGVEWAGSGLIATLRDITKIGLLYLDAGTRVLPAHWIAETTRAGAPHLEPGRLLPGSPFGYGLHWWLTPTAFSAIGIYNQYLYVDPRRRVVIAKFSANRRYASSYDEAGYRDAEHMALFEAIASDVEIGDL